LHISDLTQYTGEVDIMQVKWANAQAIDAKFSRDLTHQRITKIG